MYNYQQSISAPEETSTPGNNHKLPWDEFKKRLLNIPAKATFFYLGAQRSNQNLELGEMIASFDKNKWVINFHEQNYTGENSINLLMQVFSLQNNLDLNDKNHKKTVFKLLLNWANENLNKLEENYQEIKNKMISSKKKEEEFKNKRTVLKQLSDKYNLINIKEILKMFNAKGNEDRNKDKWKMPWGDNLSANGKQEWHNFNSQQGGWGAVNLTIHLLAREQNLDDTDKKVWAKLREEAIKTISEYFEEEIDFNELYVNPENIEKDYVIFSPPMKLPNQIHLVKKYLVEERGLPEEKINELISENKIYAGVIDWQVDKKIKHNQPYPENKVYCVFLLPGKLAECRSIKSEGYGGFTKGHCTGSDKKNFGFMITPKIEADQLEGVSMTEGAIDAISYSVFHPKEIIISLGGCDNMELMLKTAKECIENDIKFTLALDNDDAGMEASNNFEKNIKKEISEEKYLNLLADGKIIYRHAQIGKDWNEELIFKNLKNQKKNIEVKFKNKPND